MKFIALIALLSVGCVTSGAAQKPVMGAKPPANPPPPDKQIQAGHGYPVQDP